MSWWYRNLVRPALFTQDAEEVHNRTMRALAWAGRHETVCGAVDSFFGSPELPTEVFGLKFPNPVGLAAGMDKYAAALPTWEALGFGFTELGAVTWLGQPGNPAPRLFRAIPERVIINRMGFNNPGAEAVAKTLAEWRELGRWPKHPVGINLGKSKATPLDKAPEDYANSFRALRDHADFFVVNVSSPNTPNLRQLQDKAALEGILEAIDEVQRSEVRGQKSEVRGQRSEGQGIEVRGQRSEVRVQSPSRTGTKPILVKVAPDLSFEALDEILELVGPCKIAGIVATNTTITRPETKDVDLARVYGEAGGLSGPPLRARSTEVVRHLYRQTKGQLPIIGVGGIFDAADAWEKIAAGACLLQIYTGLVYEGPAFASAIVKGLLQRLEQKGVKTLAAAVGSAAAN
jgi:dihydroorotate dehydrogenase